MHYVPVTPKATQDDLKKIVQYFKDHDELAEKIADRGFRHIWDNLTDENVKCYWRRLLMKYSKLIKYDVVKDRKLLKIK